MLCNCPLKARAGGRTWGAAVDTQARGGRALADEGRSPSQAWGALVGMLQAGVVAVRLTDVQLEPCMQGQCAGRRGRLGGI